MKWPGRSPTPVPSERTRSLFRARTLISASGYGSISSPIYDGDAIYGLVTSGVFIGRSTETSLPAITAISTCS